MACLIAAAGIAWACGNAATARPAQEMLPEESAAKAKLVLQQVIAALGGQAYLNVRDSDCVGRVWQPVPVGTRPDSTEFRDLWLLPDKNRMEYAVKSDQTILPFVLGSSGLWFARGSATVVVFDGSGGWILDPQKRVEDQPDDIIKGFNDDLKASMNNMLRVRLNEPGVEARYAGTDIIDLKEAEWIEFTDRDHRSFRLGVEQSTHLPLRWVVLTRDPETRRTNDVTTSYIQYMAMDGVETPLRIDLYRNDTPVTKTYLSSCKYNTDLSPQLFTRASLEQRAKEKGKKDDRNLKNAK
jgi:hypothetical protein